MNAVFYHYLCKDCTAASFSVINRSIIQSLDSAEKQIAVKAFFLLWFGIIFIIGFSTLFLPCIVNSSSFLEDDTVKLCSYCFQTNIHFLLHLPLFLFIYLAYYERALYLSSCNIHVTS